MAHRYSRSPFRVVSLTLLEIRNVDTGISTEESEKYLRLTRENEEVICHRQLYK